MTITRTLIACRSYSPWFIICNHYCFGIFIVYVLKQNGSSGVKKDAVNGQSKRTKRRQDSSDSQHSEKAKKCRKKKSKKSKERSEETKRASSPTHTVSDPAASDSEEDYSLCAAPWCREPEGDEVCKNCHYMHSIHHFECFMFLFWKCWVRSSLKTFLSSSRCFSGKLGPMWRQLQSVVPPDLCGTVCRASRERGLCLHKLHTARLRQRMRTKKRLWRISSSVAGRSTLRAHLNSVPCGFPFTFWLALSEHGAIYLFPELQKTSVTVFVMWLVFQPIN